MLRRRVAVWCFGLAIMATWSAAPAVAQQDDQPNLFHVRIGNPLSGDDPFCLYPSATFPLIAFGFDTPRWGIQVERIADDWPWPDEGALAPPAGAPNLFLSHGDAYQASAHVNVASFFAEGINRIVRPFVGVGIHHSTDGEAAPASGSDGPTYGVRGQTRPFYVVGANAFVPFGAGGRFGATAGYRLTSILAGDFEFDTPPGVTQGTVDGRTLTSHLWAVGFTLRVGGGS
jgi:hypothetical protein